MLTRRDFEKIQKTTGFNFELLEKAYHLTRVLNEMQKNPVLNKNLTLKGGTALNFIYLDIPRLSIDLDFDYTGKIAKEEIQNITSICSSRHKSHPLYRPPQIVS